ncbi:MAG: hypothetical protein ACREMM_10385 [Gemmatimonadales bacterium]
MRSSLTTLLLLVLRVPDTAHAQASPYVALDDPCLPALEHLIARGDVEDPSPLVRPFRRADARRVLAAADSTPDTPSGRLIRALRVEFEDPSGDAWWRLAGRGGAQAYSHARRDALHPAGPGGTRPYADVLAEAVFGNLALVSRPTAEPRLVTDPDWPGRKDLQFTGRHSEGYISAQFRWARLYYGQMDMNWGPPVVPGIGVSNYGYPRPGAGFEVGGRSLKLSAFAAQLRDETDAASQTVQRYFFAHRIDARLSDRLQLGLWETSVLAGVDRSFDARYRNPVTLLVLANQYGLGDEGGNVLVGLDAQWRVSRRTTLQMQLGIDDIQYENRTGPTRVPDRYAFIVVGSGPLGSWGAWRAYYTLATSLALRTLDHFEGLWDAGVGLGRNFADGDQLSLLVTVPATVHWLLTPELTLLRQGEGRITDPFPATDAAAGATPTVFIGTMERTYRVALGVSGRQGALSLAANAGLHHVVNSGHQRGRTENRFEGRLTFTLGVQRQGWFQ